MLSLIANFRPASLYRIDRNEPQFAYTNPSGTNGFQQMKQAQIPLSGGQHAKAGNITAGAILGAVPHNVCAAPKLDAPGTPASP